jgi:TetR/AcrR family transcriptional regulator, ethionamide resistance regulator
MMPAAVSSVTRSRPKHRARRAEATARVCAATESLLRDGESFTERGTERIAEAAGIARSTFYVHFEDKGDLLIRMATDATDELFAASDEWWDHDHSGGTAPLAAVILKLLRIYRRHAAVLGAVLEVGAYDESVAAFWRERIEGYAAYMRDKIADEQRAGRVAADVDPRTTALIIAWSVERSVAEHIRAAAPARDRAFADQLARSAWLTMFGQTTTQGEA